MLWGVIRVVVTVQSGAGITTVRPVSVVVHDEMDRNSPRRPRREKRDHAQSDGRPQETRHPAILLRPCASDKLQASLPADRAQTLAHVSGCARTPYKSYFCRVLDLAQAQSFGQLHLPPLSQEQFIRPHAEHFMENLLRRDASCNAGAKGSAGDRAKRLRGELGRGWFGPALIVCTSRSCCHTLA